jgi:hypothetical protein
VSLPLTPRWTLRERRAYDKALRAGRFAEASAIIDSRLTPEEKAAADAAFEKLCGLLCDMAEEDPGLAEEV